MCNLCAVPGSTVTLGSPDSGEAAANLSGTNFHQIADEVWKESSQFSNQRIKTRNGLLKSLSPSSSKMLEITLSFSILGKKVKSVTFSGWSWFKCLCTTLPVYQGFPGGSAGKEFACNAGELGLIPELVRSPEVKGYSLQYSDLENSMDCTAHGITKSWTRLSDFHTA